MGKREVTVTEDGRVLGDSCEAIEGYFVWGVQRCGARSVAFAVDAEWGTHHVVCAVHVPPGQERA